MKFSVVTPTYQANGCIDRCIESVAKQTYPVHQHIIVDGGSKDGTVEYLQQQCRQKPHLIFSSEKDGGIYDAMNKGVVKASGDYILFLGADDLFWDENVLSRVAETLLERRPPVIYGNVQAVGTGLGGVPDGGTYGGKFDLNRLLSYNICHQAIFYSRETMRTVGEFNTRYRYFADWHYNLRCFSRYTFEYLDLIISRYNTYGRSTGGEDNAFHADFFAENQRNLGISLLSPHYKHLADYMIFSGKLRLRRSRNPRDLFYFAAAGWHSPKALVNQIVKKAKGPFNRS